MSLNEDGFNDGVCILGDCLFQWNTSSSLKETILPHLLSEHKMVIANVHTVYDVNQYCKYWRNKINRQNLGEYLHGINVHKGDEESVAPELYFMLNDNSAEDKALRHKIHSDKLKSVLRQQQKERSQSDLSVQCLFCPATLAGTRFTVSEHFYKEHSFTIGHPDNVVHTVEFIEHLRSKMRKSECLYCDKTFRDYKTLREHMRKKLHKKLNPSNTEFDKYYIVNYREFGKTWQHLNNDKEDTDIKSESRNGTEESWEDWQATPPEIHCLVCEVVYTKFGEVKDHMRIQHSINFDSLTQNMSYYKQVRLINYFRYQIADSQCPLCEEPYETHPNISSHLLTHGHVTYMSHDRYNDDRYLCPALDNDYMLCCLKESESVDEEDDVTVIPEDR